MLTVILLLCSNTFMTIAWYGHLKFKTAPLVTAILLSWGIAFFEYCFQVPANRYGHADPSPQVEPNQVADAGGGESSWFEHAWHAKFSAPQLKIIQEVITILAFVVFNALVLKDVVRTTDWAAYGLIVLAVVVMMYPRLAEAKAAKSPDPGQPIVSQPKSAVQSQIDYGASSNRPGDSK